MPRLSRNLRLQESANKRILRKTDVTARSAEVTMAAYQTVAQRNLTCAIRIRERRRQLGLTQAELVDRVNGYGSRLSSQALSAIENGRRLAVGRLPDLAAALQCTVSYLLGLTADPDRWEPDDAGPAPSAQPERPRHDPPQQPSRTAPSRPAPSRTAPPARAPRPATAGSSGPTCRTPPLPHGGHHEVSPARRGRAADPAGLAWPPAAPPPRPPPRRPPRTTRRSSSPCTPRSPRTP